MKNTLLVLSLLILSVSNIEAQKKDKNKNKITFEDIQAICPKTPLNKRVRLSVSSFNSATAAAYDKFGDELAQMLTNTLQNVNCFNVLLSKKDLGEIEGELELAQTGAIKQGSGAQTGQMKGAQVIVMGKVTEYSEGKSGVGIMGVSVGKNKFKLGFIVQLINTESREIIDSKSINVEGSAGGLTGVSLFGTSLVGSQGPSNGNKALADAMEKGVIEAVEFIASKKDDLPFPEAQENKGPKVYNRSNCELLKADYVPKIMVILPEFHLTRRIPDPAAETEINRKLIEAGFPVIDAAMFATNNNGISFEEAAKNPKMAISLGREFGADLVIYGEAFSELSTNQGKQVSCRARVEIKVVRTDDATIVAAHGLEAGALDNVESIASKSALRNAGGLVVDYVLEQLCSKDLVFEKPVTKKK